MGLFDFVSMADNYEERKVDRYEKGDTIIDTCAVNDSSKPFETAVQHPKYNSSKWIKTMTSSKLPKKIRDVSTSEIANLIDVMKDDDWRKMESD